MSQHTRTNAQETFPLCSSCDLSVNRSTAYTPSEALLEILRSKHVHTEAHDIQRASELAASAENEAKTLQIEADRLRATLTTIERQVYNVSAYAAQQRALIAPIRRLPTELLAEVLLYIAAEATFDILQPYYPALIVSQVCQRWRDIMQSSGRFWTPEILLVADVTLPVDMVDDGITPRRYLEGVARLRSALQHYLRLARDAPVDVRLVERAQPPTVRSLQMGKALCACIIPQISRWRSCHLPMYLAADLEEYTRGMALPYLESLVIAESSDTPNDSSVDAFEVAPSLRRLTAPGISLTVSWAQLTYIHITDWVSVDLFVHVILKSCSSLRYLRTSIAELPPMWVAPTPGSSAILPALDELVVTVEESNVLGTLFRYITAPALTRLTIEGSSPEDELTAIAFLPEENPEITSFVDFVARSQCRITELRLRYLTLSSPLLLEALAALPHLDYLGIYETGNVFSPDHPELETQQIGGFRPMPSNITSGLFVAMTPDPTNAQDVLLPHLSKMYIESGIYYHVQEDPPLRKTIKTLCDAREGLTLVLQPIFMPWLNIERPFALKFDEHAHLMDEFGTESMCGLEEETGEVMGIAD